MAKMINSVLGPISTAELGNTLMHEHAVTCCDWSMRMALGDLYFDRETVLNYAVSCLKKAGESGITTIVDGTPINLGRDIHLIIEAAKQSGMNILASTGFYHQEESIAGFKSEDELVDLLYKDCTLGMTGTAALPAIMKCAVDYKGFSPYIMKILRVTARVSQMARIPVFCHTIPELEQGDRLLDIFEELGVPLNAVIVGHSGDVDNMEYFERLLKRGCYVGLDRFGYEYSGMPSTSLENRTKTAAELIRRGWGKKLVVSHDFAPYSGYAPGIDGLKAPDYESSLDFTVFSNKVIPMLYELQISKEQVNDLLTTNPRRFFEEAYK